MMTASITQSDSAAPVLQFSVFADNKVGRLSELIQRLGSADIHVIALTVLDSTECTIMRFIPDYPEPTRRLLQNAQYAFTESEILAVELNSEADLKFVTTALVEAEININYLYPFLMRPQHKCALALHVEDNEFARTILESRQIVCLNRKDIAR